MRAQDYGQPPPISVRPQDIGDHGQHPPSVKAQGYDEDEYDEEYADFLRVFL